MKSSRRRVLHTISRIGRELAKGLLRIGVVIAVYVVSAFTGVIIAVTSSQEGLQSVLLAAGAGLLLPAVALTGGFLGWLSPATIRIYAGGGNPDLDYAVPRPADAVLLVGIASLIAGTGAWWLHLSIVGFAGLALVSSAIIVAVGGAKVAELWGHIVTATLELIAGG
jgi:hypothetical protein